MKNGKPNLRLAVTGRGGVGKSRFGASMVTAKLGKVLYIECEKKFWNLPDELLEHENFVLQEVSSFDECLNLLQSLNSSSEGAEYDNVVLDSWGGVLNNIYTPRLGRHRKEVGELDAKLPQSELKLIQREASVLLEALCRSPHSWNVVMIDQVEQGGERADNDELGRVLNLSLGGFEFFVDCVIELELLKEGFANKQQATVIKSNVDAYNAIGVKENATFETYYSLLPKMPKVKRLELGKANGKPAKRKGAAQTAVITPDESSLNELRQLMSQHKVSNANMLSGASHYLGRQVSAIGDLSEPDVRVVIDRMREFLSA